MQMLSLLLSFHQVHAKKASAQLQQLRSKQLALIATIDSCHIFCIFSFKIKLKVKFQFLSAANQRRL
jgi:hypothetical protein